MSNRSLLIIDDDESFSRVWGHILGQAGFEVTIVPDATRAREHLESHKPDAILCDVNLPGVDGFSFCQHLKVSPHTRDIPVILTSAFGDEIKRQMSQECSAKGYLEKPFCRRDLFAVLRQVLEPEPTQTQTQPDT